MKYSKVLSKYKGSITLSSNDYNISRDAARVKYGNVSCYFCGVELFIYNGKNDIGKFQLRVKKNCKHKKNCDYSFEKKLLDNPKKEVGFLFDSIYNPKKNRERNSDKQTTNDSTDGLRNSSEKIETRLKILKESLQNYEKKNEFLQKGLLINKKNPIKMNKITSMKNDIFILELENDNKDFYSLNHSCYENPKSDGEKWSDYIRWLAGDGIRCIKKDVKMLKNFSENNSDLNYIYIKGHYKKAQVINLFIFHQAFFIC